jgi:1-acyl-sn-glycerol-3-phosphate acyltransferase
MAYRVPLSTRFLRSILRPAFRLLLRILSPISITGLKNVPKKGPYIAAINHISLYEAPLIVAFWPVPMEILGAVEIWNKPGQNILARMYGGLPVHRGQYDRHALELALSVLESGRPLLIAPEGGRSHAPGMRQAQTGVAYLSDKTGVPIVPVGIVGTTEDYAKQAFSFKRPPLGMYIGEPLRLAPVTGKGAERRQALRENTDFLMKHIADLLPPEYRGYYM